MKYRLILIVLFLLMPSYTIAQSVNVNLASLTAKGIAIYGWHNGVPTVLYGEKENTLFPIASITKLASARAVELLYPQNSTLTISEAALLHTQEDNGGILPGMVFSRDDLLRSMLISSNNGVANQFALSAAPGQFLATMNIFLHAGGYTTKNFINPSGLDPTSKIQLPNRLTPKNLSYLLSDIYRTDPLLTEILKEKSAVITDQKSGTKLDVKTTNKINRDPLYSSAIILSKTGVTDLAGQDLVFIASGEGKFDYITVVFLHSKSRYDDGRIILDWLQQVLHFQGFN
ncbi:MAG: hypothetical protein ABIO57_03460 [Candidatus Paceibacterota bacterium]